MKGSKKTKYVSVNFKYVPDESMLPDITEVHGDLVRDYRNDITSVDTRFDTLDFYINYLETVQSLYQQWKGTGYFDYGMIPMGMGPTSIESQINTFISNVLQERGIPYYEVQAVSLLKNSCNSKTPKDIWVLRSDLANYMKTDELAVSSIQFMKLPEVKQAWIARAR